MQNEHKNMKSTKKYSFHSLNLTIFVLPLSSVKYNAINNVDCYFEREKRNIG